MQVTDACYHIKLHQEHIWKGIKLITLVVMGTHYISRCKSNYHMIIPNKSPYSVRILVSEGFFLNTKKKTPKKTKNGNTSVLCSKFSVIFKNDMICHIGLSLGHPYSEWLLFNTNWSIFQTRRSYILMRWWCTLCTRLTAIVRFV